LRRTVRAAGEGAAPGEGLASLRWRRLPAPARGWRRRRGEKWLRGGKRSDDHEVSIRMRLGDGDLAGRGPSKVSTMIIRPPQHGQRRAGPTSSASHLRPRRANAVRHRKLLSRMGLNPMILRQGCDFAFLLSPSVHPAVPHRPYRASSFVLGSRRPSPSEH
jgi:hypothetical protein